MAYGSSRRGCFENPDDKRPPSDNLDCPDIAPVELEERDGLPNPQAMKNPSQLVRKSLNQTLSIFVSLSKLIKVASLWGFINLLLTDHKNQDF